MKLDAAIKAARQESSESPAGDPNTRRRVLASLERAPRRRFHAAIAAVIASMFGASAFAAWYATTKPPAPAVATKHSDSESTPAPSSRGHVRVDPTPPVVVPDLADRPPAPVEPPPAPVEPPPAPVEPPPARVEQSAAPRVEQPPVAPSRARIEVPRVEPPPVDKTVVRAPEPARTPYPAEATAPTRDAAPAAAVQADAELALYATAHELHFKRRDMHGALAAWERYLAVAASGKLAPEARFNRLVALVKLERWTDAAAQIDAMRDSTFRRDDLERMRTLVHSHLAH